MSDLISRQTDVTDINVGDLISRQAAIDAMADLPYGLRGMVKGILTAVPSALDCKECIFAPFKRKTGKWIPVTERLPEKYIGEWLCCTDDGKIMILPYDTPGDGSKECVFYAWDDDGYFYQTFNVTHWMPLPKPPKGEREDYE